MDENGLSGPHTEIQTHQNSGWERHVFRIQEEPGWNARLRSGTGGWQELRPRKNRAGGLSEGGAVLFLTRCSEGQKTGGSKPQAGGVGAEQREMPISWPEKAVRSPVRRRKSQARLTAVEMLHGDLRSGDAHLGLPPPSPRPPTCLL